LRKIVFPIFYFSFELSAISVPGAKRSVGVADSGHFSPGCNFLLKKGEKVQA
jgi:hypothetical protein